MGSAWCTPFPVPFESWTTPVLWPAFDVGWRFIPRSAGEKSEAVHPVTAFLGVATFLNPIQIGSGATTSSRVPIHFLQVWRDQF